MIHQPESQWDIHSAHPMGKYLKGGKVVQVWALRLFGFSTSLASCEHLSLWRSVQYIDAWHKDDGGAFYCFAAHSQLFGSRRRRGLDRQRPLRSRQSVHTRLLEILPWDQVGVRKGIKNTFWAQWPDLRMYLIQPRRIKVLWGSATSKGCSHDHIYALYIVFLGTFHRARLSACGFEISQDCDMMTLKTFWGT